MKAVPLNDQSGYFDLDTAKEFKAGDGMAGEGTVYRTDKGHFVRYSNAAHAAMSDVDAFFWLLRNGHQDAAKEFLATLWAEKLT
jgi:hypothetical protein